MTQLIPACARPTVKFPEGRTGTEAGYAAHRRIGEPSCRSCLDANNARSDQRRVQAEQSPEYAERRRARSREAEKRYLERHPERARASAARRAAKGTAIIREAKNRPCTDCGIQYPYYVMQFDHLDPTEKSFGVGLGTTRALDVLRAEIAKCEVVCANCHSERTHQRRNAA